MSALGPIAAIAASGMAAAETRLNVAAQNVSNADTVRSTSGASPAQPPLRAGMVVAPAIDMAEQLIDMRVAMRQFQASVRVFQAANATTKSLLDIKS